MEITHWTEVVRLKLTCSGICENRITVIEWIKHKFWYEGPLGPNLQFRKGSHVEIFIGNGCIFL